MKILAIGAHADDVELGCGGALLKWGREGHDLAIHIATDSGYDSYDGTPVRSAEDATAEAEASAERLGASLSIGDFKCLKLAEAVGLSQAILAVIDREKPDILLTHWEADTHADHAALARATLHAARRVPTVLTYASNAYPSTEPHHACVYVDISDVLEEKLKLVALFASENGRTHGAWLDWLRAHAKATGYAAGVGAAEAFGIVKQRLVLAAGNPTR